jgi:ribosomal protein S18 acetylase RimI-like enzyme
VLTVRAATEDDAEDIVRINVHAWQRAYAGIVPQEVLDTMEVEGRVERYRYRMRQSPGFEHLVAADDDKVIGYACVGNYRLGQRPDGTLHRDIGEVTAIYVDPPWWGTGAGRALMDAALARLVERGFTTARLWVLAANHQARRFYERAGFAVDGATAGYPVACPDGSVIELPEVRYARPLP